MFKTPLKALVGIMLVAFLVMPSAVPRSGPEWKEGWGTLPAFAVSGFALAQSIDQEGRSEPETKSGESPGVLGPAISGTLVDRVIQIIRVGERECGGLPLEYRADCLQQTFRRAAQEAEKGGAYSAAAAHLRSAATRISSLVARNVDPVARPIAKGTKSYRAVKKSAVRAVNAAAAAIVTETETKLLRSAGSSQQRKVHYQRIAQAVGSTKRILRS
jgi:hypothetical protein